MKILERGKADCWETEQICTGRGNGDGGCGAKLLVSEKDIRVTKHTCIDDSVSTYYKFKCPCCNKKTNIPEKEIPYSVRDNVMKK